MEKRHWLLVILLLGSQALIAAAGDLEILIGEERRRVDSRENLGRVYYELKDIAEILGLTVQESGEELTLKGSRGMVFLTNARPLVRFSDQYILLSAPVWKRKEKSWYVPEDLLAKVIPLIMNLKLEPVGQQRYRVAALAVNPVRVELANYPDHVRILFYPSRDVPMQVKEFKNYIQVEFQDYLVKPELPEREPDARMVSSLEFNSRDVYGSFRIHKGDQYFNFRELTLRQPTRKVIDVYAPPVRGRVSGPLPSPAPESADVSPPAQAVPQAPPPSPYRASTTPVVTIDPGHGGDDYGVQPTPELLEKNLTMNIATRIEGLLQASRYQAVLTRRRDVDLPLEQRSAAGNHYRSRAYVSIHAGGSPRSKTGGPMVWVHRYGQDGAAAQGATVVSGKAPADGDLLTPWEEGQRKQLEQSRRLARAIQNELNHLFQSENSVREAPLALLEPVLAPAVLIEAGFLTHQEDSLKLGSREFQDRIAEAIIRGLLRFLEDSPQ